MSTNTDPQEVARLLAEKDSILSDVNNPDDVITLGNLAGRFELTCLALENLGVPQQSQLV